MPPKTAKFPASLKLGGDVTYAGRTFELSSDGAELLYGDTQALFHVARGAKALAKLDTQGQSLTATASMLERGRAVVGFPSDEDGPHVDVCTVEGSTATLRLPGDAALHGCIASLDADAIVAWGWDSIDDKRPHLWWWSLGAPAKKPTALSIAPSGMVLGAAFVGSTLFVTIDDHLFSATSAGVKPVSLAAGIMPSTLTGARTGSHLLARSAKKFVVLTTSGKVVHSFPPFLKLARLTNDGAQVVGYGQALRHQQVPPDVLAAHPELLQSDFVAHFDAASGKRLGWGKIADSVDQLQVVDGDLIVTKSVKRIAFHPWKLVSENA